MKTFYVFFWQNGKIVKHIAEAETKEEVVKYYDQLATSDVLVIETSNECVIVDHDQVT